MTCRMLVTCYKYNLLLFVTGGNEHENPQEYSGLPIHRSPRRQNARADPGGLRRRSQLSRLTHQALRGREGCRRHRGRVARSNGLRNYCAIGASKKLRQAHAGGTQ